MAKVADPESARVVSLTDGAKNIGYNLALADLAGCVAELMRRRRIAGITSENYSAAVNDMLAIIQALMAQHRKK
jgi:hypothetical protein